MRYSDFTQRIAGDGAAAWDIHYRALARVEQGEEILLLSVGDPDFDTPAPIVQSAIDSLLAGNTHTPTCAASAPCASASPSATGGAAARRWTRSRWWCWPVPSARCTRWCSAC